MSATLLLNLSAQRVTFGVFARGRLGSVASHPNDGTAAAAFAALLDAHPGRPVRVMLDVVEEDFRCESLPHVLGRAREEMTARKLTQYFRTAPYRAACRQGRLEGPRRDDQYLFVAVTNGDLLRPYLDLIEARRAPLAGVWLLPVVSQALAARLFPRGGVLLVSFQGAGLRQSLFVDGWLRISRLTPAESAGQKPEALLAEELEKSRLFLYNSRLYPRDAPLQAIVLDPAGDLAEACARIAPEPQFRCQALGGAALARAFGLAQADFPRDMDALMLCLLGRQIPPCNLAQPQLTTGYTLHRLRRGIQAVAAGIAVMGVVAAGYQLNQARTLREQAAVARQEAALIKARYDEAARSFPAAPASAEHMRRVVEAAQLLHRLDRRPDAAFALLGRVLTAFPQVELSRLGWRRTDLSPAEGAPAARESVEVTAEIRPFDGDYRAALALIERLAQALRSQPGVQEVRLTQLPVNLDPKAPLAGNTAERPENARAQFKLAVTLGAPS